MIQIYNGKADSFEATLIDPEALGIQPAYGLGATPQLAIESLKQALQQRITLLQAIDYSQISSPEKKLASHLPTRSAKVRSSRTLRLSP